MNAAVCKTSVPHTIHLCPRKETWVSAHLIAMPKNKSLSLSDFMRGPDSAVRDFSEVQEDDDTEYVKEYGIGIDCHSKFIEVCVRYRNGRTIKKAQGHFSTCWDDLVAARDWCIDILSTKADPAPDLSEPLHYLVESTANYHMPLCMAWQGRPTIINPTIAGATKRKTDVLDSRLLALHDQINTRFPTIHVRLKACAPSRSRRKCVSSYVASTKSTTALPHRPRNAGPGSSRKPVPWNGRPTPARFQVTR